MSKNPFRSPAAVALVALLVVNLLFVDSKLLSGLILIVFAGGMFAIAAKAKKEQAADE